MKLPIKLSRSRSNSPPSSPSTSSPRSPPRKLRSFFPNLTRSSSRGLDPSCDQISEVSSPSTSLPSPSSCTLSHGKVKASATASSSLSVQHGKEEASEPCATASSSSRSARPGKVGISDKQMHEIQEIFAEFDANGDGKISAEELRSMLALLGDDTTSEEAALMVREADMDGDGYIDLGEFVDLNARCLEGMVGDKEMEAAFAIFDLDKDGQITAVELQEVLGRLGGGGSGRRTTVEDCKRMIRGVDRKGTGHVDFDDFKRMMTLTF